jgi:hypothetical protein
VVQPQPFAPAARPEYRISLAQLRREDEDLLPILIALMHEIEVKD